MNRWPHMHQQPGEMSPEQVPGLPPNLRDLLVESFAKLTTANFGKRVSVSGSKFLEAARVSYGHSVFGRSLVVNATGTTPAVDGSGNFFFPYVRVTWGNGSGKQTIVVECTAGVQIPLCGSEIQIEVGLLDIDRNPPTGATTSVPVSVSISEGVNAEEVSNWNWQTGGALVATRLLSRVPTRITRVRGYHSKAAATGIVGFVGLYDVTDVAAVVAGLQPTFDFPIAANLDFDIPLPETTVFRFGCVIAVSASPMVYAAGAADEFRLDALLTRFV